MNTLNQQKCIIPISMFYISIMICSDLLVNKPVVMFKGYTTAATLVFPLWFILNDIIAEVYGYKTCRKIMWIGFITEIIFNMFCYVGSHLPSPADWNNQPAFDLILAPLMRITLGTFVAFIISGYINIYLLTKWKALMSGKHFWLRSIGSSTIGEIIYSILVVWIILLGTMETSKILMIMLWSFSIKVIYTIVMAYPAALVVQVIKRIEGIRETGYEKVKVKKYAEPSLI
jgi:uncharacterized integral membrane protein (TIGR00697 family)